MGIIHMNGRVYDPLIGRFMSADPHIQAPYNLKSFNRYSYAWNNPLKLVDPTGFEVDFSDPEPPGTEPVDCGSGCTTNLTTRDRSGPVNNGQSFTQGVQNLGNAIVNGFSSIFGGGASQNTPFGLKPFGMSSNFDVSIFQDESRIDPTEWTLAGTDYIIYKRIAPDGGCYVGHCMADRFSDRMSEHDRATKRANTYEVQDRLNGTRTDARVAEETKIRQNGGIDKLENQRFEMNEQTYRANGGTESKPATNASRSLSVQEPVESRGRIKGDNIGLPPGMTGGGGGRGLRGNPSENLKND
jgi:hypothetical protein